MGSWTLPFPLSAMIEVIEPWDIVQGFDLCPLYTYADHAHKHTNMEQKWGSYMLAAAWPFDERQGLVKVSLHLVAPYVTWLWLDCSGWGCLGIPWMVSIFIFRTLKPRHQILIIFIQAARWFGKWYGKRAVSQNHNGSDEVNLQSIEIALK